MTKTFGRIGYIEIAGGPTFAEFQSNGITPNYKWKRFNGLDIKFDISFPLFSDESEASISILGLSRDWIEAISSWGAEATTNSQNWIIRVYGGYGDNEEDVPCLFEGQIVTAMPTMPPDVWLNIKARTFYGRRHQFSMNDWAFEMMDDNRHMRLGDFLEAFCNRMNASYYWADLPDEILNKWITVPILDKAMDLKKQLDFIDRLCRDNNVAYYTSHDAHGKATMIFQPLVFPVNYKPLSALPVSSKTGMVGIPKMTYAEIEVTHLLTEDTSSRLLSFIDVESRFAFPGMYDTKGNRQASIYNALFRVNHTRFHGHLRGQEWYVTWKAWRNFCKSDTIRVSNNQGIV